MISLAEKYSHRSYHRQHALEALLRIRKSSPRLRQISGRFEAAPHQQVSPLHPGGTDLDHRDPTTGTY